jgi:hypothetical protein
MHLEDGKIVEVYITCDRTAVLQLSGLMPGNV